MLRAAGIGMRHPDRRQSQPLRRTRRWAASRRNSAGSPAPLPVVLQDRVRRPVHPGTVDIGARRGKALRAADLHHREAVGMQMRAHGVDRPLRLLVPTTKRSCSTALRAARNGVGRASRYCPTTSPALPACSRQTAALPAVSPPRPSPPPVAGSSAVGSIFTSASAARTAFEIRGGLSASSFIRPLPSTRLAIALHRIVAGLARTPPQLPEWCPPSRRLTSRWMRLPPRQPRKMVGRSAESRGPSEADEQVGLQLLAMGFAHLPQIGRADLLAGLDDELGVEAELAAAGLAHRAQGRQVDAVLALVVGGAAAIDALALWSWSSRDRDCRAIRLPCRRRRRHGRR